MAEPLPVYPLTVDVSIQNPVRLGRYTEPEPDVVLLRRDRDFARVPHTEDVLLAVEVVESSVGFDRNVKLPRYSAAGVPEVWIVNIPDDCIECYRHPSDAGYRSEEVVGMDSSATAEQVSELGAIFIRDLLDNGAS